MDRVQTTAERSGGSSRLEARRGGRTQRGEGGRSRPVAWGDKCPHRASIANLPVGAADGALGSPGSPHGAAFRHGPPSRLVGGGLGAGDGVRKPDSRGPQQQDAPLHRVPHLQWCACPTASKDETEEAAATGPPAPNTNTAAGSKRRMNVSDQKFRARPLTRDHFPIQTVPASRGTSRVTMFDSRPTTVKGEVRPSPRALQVLRPRPRPFARQARAAAARPRRPALAHRVGAES